MNIPIAAPEGFNVPAVESWIQGNVSSLSPPLKWTKLEGGHSNITYKIVDSNGNPAVIRRPPMGKLLPKAHDMGREWSLISALATTSVPVPKPLGFCEDTSVTGAWFYVMDWVDGRALFIEEDVYDWVPDDKRYTLAFSFIDHLADLHSLDPDEIGLGELGRKDDYIIRQVTTWYKSWLASIEGAELDDPRAHELKEFFLSNTPPQGKARIVHGDYYLHNCLTGADSTIVAVLDWEICTLGDPLADVGYVMHKWAESIESALPGQPSSAKGFPFRDALVTRYGERTGRDVSALDFYVAFNYWKTACIVHGVYSRYKKGSKSAEGANLKSLKRIVFHGLNEAETIVKRLQQN